ncbi:MAG TPA: hypothetical protein VJX72_01950 [Candidatus Acidoferrum sp.]|nr:hypothetical protein [Candidatus Acidoferrum sp.]
MPTTSLNSPLASNHLAFHQKVDCFLLLAISSYMLLWVAVFNGYPVFYPDSSQYLSVSVDLQSPIYRTISYSIFIRLVSLGISPWLVVIAQSVITIFVLHRACNFIARQNAPSERGGLVFMGLTVFLAFGTTLPWFVGQIMPDVFTGLSFLSLFLLLYDSKISLERTVLISAVLCISVGTHITHLLTVTLLLLAIFVLRAFGVFREFWPTRSIKGIVACVLVPILGITGLLALSNWRSGFGFTLSPAKPVFLLGRLIESGLAADYLQQRCGIEELTPCKYLHNLPKTSEEFLWGSHPLLKEMGGWNGATGEASRIVSGIIRQYPLRFAAECVRQMFRQFVAFTAGSGNYAIRSGPEFEGFRELYPGDVQKYLLSRQSLGRLAMDAYRVTPVYTAVFWCSLGVGLMALFTRRLPVRMANQLFVLTLIFLFMNALVTGSLSGVNDRYQARASWLMGLSCAAYVIPYVSHRRNRRRVIDLSRNPANQELSQPIKKSQHTVQK